MDSAGMKTTIHEPTAATRRYVMVENGVVVNSATGDPAWREAYLKDFPGQLVIESDEAAPGWRYRDGEFSRPPATESATS